MTGLQPLPRILAIGSSTGGPAALEQLLRQLHGQINIPVVITQHMPAHFIDFLAEDLARNTAWPVVVAEDGMRLQTGRVHIAPGHRHLVLTGARAEVHCQLDNGPPENFCKPAVDPMLRSVAQVYRRSALAVILTGMGKDGLEGCRAIVEAGGKVLAQDQESSVIWGMPRAVHEAGLCHAIAPLGQMAAKIANMCRNT